MLPHLGVPELVLILLVVVIIFGVGKLPEVGGALGKSIRGFQKGLKGEEEEAAGEKAAKAEAAEKPKE